MLFVCQHFIRPDTWGHRYIAARLSLARGAEQKSKDQSFNPAKTTLRYCISPLLFSTRFQPLSQIRSCCILNVLGADWLFSNNQRATFNLGQTEVPLFLGFQERIALIPKNLKYRSCQSLCDNNSYLHFSLSLLTNLLRFVL